MTTTYKYKNNYGNYLNQQQAELSEDFLKEFHVDGVLKKMERIINNSVDQIYYYLNPSENINDLLSEFANKRISFYAISTINSYTVEENLTYENSILIEKEKEVSGEYGAKYIEHIDVNNNLPLSYEKYKFRNNGDWLYFFEYNNDGTLRMITYFDENNGAEQFLPNTERANQIDWNDLQYYLSASPMIPV